MEALVHLVCLERGSFSEARVNPSSYSVFKQNMFCPSFEFLFTIIYYEFLGFCIGHYFHRIDLACIMYFLILGSKLRKRLNGRDGALRAFFKGAEQQVFEVVACSPSLCHGRPRLELRF